MVAVVAAHVVEVVCMVAMVVVGTSGGFGSTNMTAVPWPGAA